MKALVVDDSRAIRAILRRLLTETGFEVVEAGHGRESMARLRETGVLDLALVPRAWGFWSARRYVSLFKPGQAEDVFQYYRANARWTALRSVRVPIAAIVGSRDEYLDRRAEALIDAFRQNASRSRSFTGKIVAGAGHSFVGHERQLADVIVRWAAVGAAPRRT